MDDRGVMNTSVVPPSAETIRAIQLVIIRQEEVTGPSQEEMLHWFRTMMCAAKESCPEHASNYDEFKRIFFQLWFDRQNQLRIMRYSQGKL